MNFINKIFLFTVVSFFAIHICARAADADTIKMSIQDAEKRFLKENLDLLIYQADIDISKGLYLQSKLYQNPAINLNRELYSNKTKDYFPNSPTDQIDVQATLLISTAGKWVKGIKIAGKRVKLSEYQFYDVLRALKLDLRENFYQVLQNQQKLDVLNNGMNVLGKLIEAIQVQVEKGYVAKKELIRLQSLMLQFTNDKAELYNNLMESQASIKGLLNYRGNEYILPLADSVGNSQTIQTLKFDSLQGLALANRYDLLAANLNSDIGKNQLQLAKMQIAPDLSLGYDYDRFGTYNYGYHGLMLGASIPLWNFNQGNIKAARAQYTQLQLEEQSKELEIHNSLQREFLELLNRDKLYQSTSRSYYESFEEIYKNIYQSYQSRTIGLIEFLEYFESYKDTKFNLIDINTQFRIQMQKLNFEIGKDIL